MKKAIGILLTLSVLLSVCACSSMPGTPNHESTSPETPTTSTPDSTADPDASETSPSTEAGTNAPPAISSDFSTELYDVTEKDGTCYLNFKDGNQLESNENGTPSQEVGYIDFASVDDMYSRLSEGKLSDEQIVTVKRTFTHTEDGIVFPNVKKLQIPALPDGLKAGRVGVTDDTYTVSLSAAGKISSGSAKFTDESLYRALYEKNYTNFYDNTLLKNVEITSDKFDGIPCTVGSYETSVAAFRNVSFTFETEDGKTLSVMIRYCLKSYRGDIPESEAHPRRVEIYCEQNGQYAIITLLDLKVAPSAEWLTSFGITSYTPAA